MKCYTLSRLSDRRQSRTLPHVSTGLTDQQRRQLRAAFADSASDVPDFSQTALFGGYRRDEGLQNLLPADWTVYELRCALKAALRAFLDEGGSPSVESSRGDAAMAMDAATYCHFRVRVADVPLFVKVWLDEDDRDPEVRVISVKRDDRAWK